ncbi:Cytochrome P450 monooxygenase apf7 [Cladobotryum mycophilum]|uniref:Cytochrome P450 monooxygenase apf7 n=1 Tax=Cladobotryum mycophilum TaxID=491253 RepID=A0ABR0S814_9HYPO
MSHVGNTLLIAKYAFVVLILYYLLLSAYRIFAHPLKKYPGPWLARISDAYGGWYALRRRLHLQTYQDHLKYGPVIRQGPNKLVFNSATALQDIYLNHSVSKAGNYNAGNVTYPNSNVFNVVRRSLHRMKRQRVGPIASERSMRTFEPQMAQQIDIFLQQLLTSCQNTLAAPINMAERCRWMALDIVARLSFGYDLNMQTDLMHRYLVRTMINGSWYINVSMQFPFTRRLKFGILLRVVAVARGVSFLKTLTKMLKARLAQDKHAKHDLYSFMIDAPIGPEGKKVTEKEIWTEAINFVAAGGDTTSTAMSSAFFYLARNPRCKEKLLQEIQTTFESSADIHSGSKLSSCVYLRACIDEALRMSPPVPGTMWREQLLEDINTDKPFTVDGHIIPPGVHVGVNAYSIHHNEEYFPDPFVYKPERWLPAEEGSELTEAKRAAFVPFSIGARGCLGKPMAYQEASLTIAKTIWFFDFELAAESISGPDEFEVQDVFTTTHDGPYLHFHPREGRLGELVDVEK